MKKLRKVYKKENNNWIEVRMKDLKTGDKIKINEPDGSAVKMGRKTVFTVIADPEKIEKTWTVEVEDVR